MISPVGSSGYHLPGLRATRKGKGNMRRAVGFADDAAEGGDCDDDSTSATQWARAFDYERESYYWYVALVTFLAYALILSRGAGTMPKAERRACGKTLIWTMP